MMNTLAMKKLCGGLLLSGLACGVALAQQSDGSSTPSYGTDSDRSGSSSSGGGESGAYGSTSGSHATTPGGGQTAPSSGGMESGTSGMGGGGAGIWGGSGRAGMYTGVINPPEIPGATQPSDADPFLSYQSPGRLKWPHWTGHE